MRSRNTPRPKVGADPEAAQVGPLRADQRNHTGVDIEMVVVVVADDHGVDGGRRSCTGGGCRR